MKIKTSKIIFPHHLFLIIIFCIRLNLFSLTTFLLNNDLKADENAEEIPPTFHLWQDTKESLNFIKKASYLQFTDSNSVFLGTAGVFTLIATLGQKDLIEKSIREEDYHSYHKVISDMNILLSFPIVPLATYYVAKSYEDAKLKRFAQEYFATLYLTTLEVLALSFVPINERPDKQGLNPFEKHFRGKSSFPSGHMIPASTLFWKTFQFYGPLLSTIPLTLTLFTGYERVRSSRHHITDVLGTFFISGMVSEGVRMASAHEHNHPLYQWMFEHHFDIRFFKNKDAWGTFLDLTF